MNFYKHHIGDYAQATAHLSFVEDAAYVRLIRKYYAEEKPLLGDLKAIQRLVGARTKEEKSAVDLVLQEFFHFDGESWRNKRCDDELAQWKAQAETNRRIAIEREARKAKKSALANEHEPSHEPPNEPLNDSLASREPNQNPESRIQKPEEIQDQNLLPKPIKPVRPVAKPKAGFNYSTGVFENLTGEMLEVWREAYPAIDVRQEIAKAKAWLLANPKNRKSNIAKFLTNWLNRAQDNAPRIGNGQFGFNNSSDRQQDNSAAGRVRQAVERERITTRDNALAVANDGLNVRPQVGEQLRSGGGPGSGMGELLEGNFKRTD